MRKWMFLLLSVCMLLALGVQGALGEEAKIVLYAQVPETWENPCAWAWDDSGVNAFAAWPGENMEKDPLNEGWYYIHLPSSMQAVIINANEGGIQTTDYRIDKQNAWVTVAEDTTATVSFEQATTGDLPLFVEKFTLYAKVDESLKNPCLWAWEDPSGVNAFAAWPGQTMKANENGWYSVKVPEFCNSIIVNGNDGTVQTADIKDLEPADMWITVNADMSFELTYDDPNVVEVADITVYTKIPEDWQAPCLWAWSHPDGTNAYTTWPGEPFVQGEDGYYELQVAGWINSVIVNANEGTVQTSDLRVEAGKDLYVTINAIDDVTVSYEKPE